MGLVMRNLSILLTLVVVIALAIPAYAFPVSLFPMSLEKPRIDSSLVERLKTEESVDVIIMLKQDKANVLSALDGFSLKYDYNTINGFSGSLTPEGLRRIRNDPRVSAIYEDPVLDVSVMDTIPLINADDMWDLPVTGEGYALCILDTGIDYTHPDLSGCIGPDCKVIAGYDFINDDNDPMDDHGHGTEVAGIAAADGEIKGVAPSASLVAVKVCDADGECPGSAMIAGMDWCAEHASEYNIVAATISISDHGEYSDETCPAWMDSSISSAHDLGMLIAIAAGNDYHNNGISYPACSADAVSVGASMKLDYFASFTNTHASLDLLAPGAGIYTTKIGGYGYKSGTSFATPHVAGAALLLKQYAPSALPNEIENALKQTGVPITDMQTGLTFPRIDILAALSLLNPTDADNDGYFSYEDLDDSNNHVYPGAPEFCDSIDNDGDGFVDEGCPPKTAPLKPGPILIIHENQIR